VKANNYLKVSHSETTREADAASPSLLATGGIRLIQIQPTLTCNLRCRHCYSESGPEHKRFLSADVFAPFLKEARSLGYRYVGVSGGEPLLWPDLDRFLQEAIDTGFSTSVITNGTLLTHRRARQLKHLAGVVAVSVDGPPEEYAEIRGSAVAFSMMQSGLAALREEKIPFVLVFTLHRTNADRLSWLHEFADQEKALAIEIHPLCDFGAASVNFSDAIPSSMEFRIAAWILALISQKRGKGGPAIIIDVFQRLLVEKSVWPLLTMSQMETENVPFSDLVPALIVEPDGCIVPFIYGFPRSWAIGSLNRGSLLDAAESWRTRCLAPVIDVVQTTLYRLRSTDQDYIDLFGQLLKTAHIAKKRSTS
jgi:Fe-coproporphyrin III synthase